MWSCSSTRRRSDSVRGLIPGQARSSSEKRRGPSERSWTRIAVHLAPMISAHAATEQLASCTSLIVRIGTILEAIECEEVLHLGHGDVPDAPHLLVGAGVRASARPVPDELPDGLRLELVDPVRDQRLALLG